MSLLLLFWAVAAAPALPFYDWKACPFEGCSYREWTANKSVTVYDTWRSQRKAVAQLQPGAKVTGITGVVIVFRPGTIRMDRDFPEQQLKRGEIILTYAYRGEGFSAAWVHGRYEKEYDISFVRWPDGQGCGGSHCAATYIDLGKKVWRAQVKVKSGVVGWVDMDGGPFNGVDMLAGGQEGSKMATPTSTADLLRASSFVAIDRSSRFASSRYDAS